MRRTRTPRAVLTGLLLPLMAGCSVGTRLDYTHLFTRQGWQRTDRVIEALELSPGARVADLGAGDGYFTWRLADAVGPTGRVYAIEIDPEKLEALEREVEERGYSNVVVVHATADDSRLPGPVDLVFLCNTYHHIDDREVYFRALEVHLAPEARLAIVDGRHGGAAGWFIPSGHALEPGRLEAELETAGYVHVASHDFLPLQTFDVFTRAK